MTHEDRYTLDAIDDVTGRSMHFEDYVNEGQVVVLWRNPERETGFIGERTVYVDDGGEFRLRDPHSVAFSTQDAPAVDAPDG